MFNNIGFFPRELAIPEATAPGQDGEDEEAPCYLPTTDSAEGEDVSDAEVNELVRRIQAGSALEGSGRGPGSDSPSSDRSADVSDASVDRTLREVGVDPGAVEAATVDGGASGEGSVGSAEGLDPMRQSVVRILREAAQSDAASGGGSQHTTDWARTPAHWWPHGWTPAKKYPEEVSMDACYETCPRSSLFEGASPEWMAESHACFLLHCFCGCRTNPVDRGATTVTTI